ncbi:MotA/TolQ/ExbB proton channel family protein [Poseidonibacter ostreae]|jgi:biopolymer transport protein ExbB|uniref:MotA/TolQ/ExbB proton channel family protein n=1 Tax=Poseidonibacter ostreae TaxID=2654171 RepID=A0A6L4WRJ1_9BACT|nr:MotA/TolQ/ExbB proton channel family protein [Poseidonibacter ostreae]KAB7888161.1 MotA/TolQ/ExbB proton channel family protein [Poseidonibacter ostreae]KAB7892063.1 MotA/TolQ/ExbB proton channel family protein [Poseidonibacter ostreae]MAC84874.1 biopolymer transporter ExbB [Arcobacter sp.]|tara:strand:+ start:8375 stop:8884 length:510 start_codon:yes stop_codon:yes gene_type:complete
MEVDLISYINRGGIIVYILIALNTIGFTIMFWKIVVLSFSRLRKEKTINEIITFVKESNVSLQKESIDNIINRKIKKLEFGLNTVKIIASIAPLLGLLGTVVGVLNSFDSITKSGLGDPSIFSNGISIALITTVAGLIVAIPHYIGYNYIYGVLDSIELKLQKEVLKRL